MSYKMCNCFLDVGAVRWTGCTKVVRSLNMNVFC
jgi:hypothetical protein